MKFAVPVWLLGTGLALVVALVLIAGGVLLTRNVKRFGDEALVRGLLTANPSGWRAFKGVLIVIAVALAFIALAQPQYGRGTRLIPATNLDVVIVLDYSKSMYAKDISPSRTLRAKSEVGRLIQELPGARFGAVAFAGEPIAFPLTSDGASIAQFFRQLSPNDMPVGGTAIARALESGRELLERDPKSKTHKRVMILVTDGEDLEGDPVAAAESAKSADITIDVVQIGGRTPEPIPDVNDNGESHGYRVDDQGKPITTALSAEGEAQLAKIASTTGGVIVQSAHGETGITEISRRLARLVTEELSEKVETVYADVYMYPLALALFLVLLESFVNEAPRRSKPSNVPPPKKLRKKRAKKAAAVIAAGTLLPLFLASACTRQADKLFERNAPNVDEAIEAYDAGDAGSAVSLLEGYLSTGKCENGEIGTPDPVRDRPNATFDLGLGLFQMAERFGHRFGDEEENLGDAGPTPQQDSEMGQRSNGVECAERILKLIAADSTTPAEFRARAYYLAGNLEFLRRDYKAAVKQYELALRLVPGLPADAGDTIGSDAAYNRAIALRRIEDKQKDAAPPDAQPDGPQDGSPGDSGENEQKPDSGNQNDKKNQDDKDKDKNKNKDQKDAGQDGSAPKQEPPQQPDGGNDQQKPQPQPQQSNQDDRTLDMLEHAPTFQEQDAKNRALQRRTRSGMEDK